jgi:DNA repair photolyase
VAVVSRVKGGTVDELVKLKERVVSKLESLLEPREVEEARKDFHARREPIACGMTVHTGIGCSNACLYCYVPDMGFPLKPRPYPLTGLQLAYALALNPYVVVGPSGTMLAFGSVTEPFLDTTRERAFEYLEAVRKYLGNPTQIATKAYLGVDDARRFRSVAEPRISVLVTVVSLRYAGRLEPRAPPPEQRFETIQNLSRLGVHVSLFFRPLIPGVSELDAHAILVKAREAGARGVVPGSLRVTPGILRRLKAGGFNVESIVSRLPRSPRDPRDQVTIRERDVKDKVASIARRVGLKVYPSSCSANMDSHGVSCWSCRWGPCGDPKKLPEVEPEGIAEAVEALGFKPLGVRIAGSTLTVRVKGVRGRHDLRRIYHWLSTITRRNVVVKGA